MRGNLKMDSGYFYIILSEDSKPYRNELNRTYVREALENGRLKVKKNFIPIGTVVYININDNDEMILAKTDNPALYGKKIVGDLIAYIEGNQEKIFTDIYYNRIDN